MPSPFPTRSELKWAGCSLIIPQLLGLLVGIAYTIIDPEDYSTDLYDVRTEEEVIELHKVLSSAKIRTMAEINAVWYWLSFPFYLLAIYGIKKFYLSLFIGTKAEMWIYVLEKSYLFSLLVTNIIGPAISLVIVSFEWSIHAYTPDEDFIPTGYYIQLYSLLLVEELYDAICIADGLFLTLVFLIPNFRYCSSVTADQILDPKFDVLKNKEGKCRVCRHVLMVVVAVTIPFAYLISLFRFADSGFFSLNGGAAWIPIYGFILKFGIGGRFFLLGRSRSARYDELKRAFGDKAENKGKMLSDKGDEYKMETIDTANVDIPLDADDNDENSA